jgi:UDP-glucose 4-epimerase
MRVTKMKTLLITGGNGFIGRSLREYVERSGKYSILAPGHKELDLLDDRCVKEYFQGDQIDFVVHCANVGGVRKHSVQDSGLKNLRMFYNLARSSLGVEKFISLGSGAEYDRRNYSPRMKESHFDESVPVDEYGFSKYLISKHIESRSNMLNLRLFGVYGKYEDYEFKFITNSIVKNLLHLPITIRQNVLFDYTHVDDCAEIILWFLEHSSRHKQYNLSSGAVVDLVSIANVINGCSDFKSDIKIVNPGMNTEYSGDNARLLSEIGEYNFRSIEQTVPSIMDHLRSILDKIDRAKIESDPYAEKCQIRT